MFFGRHVVDDHYGGMAFEEEGARCAAMLAQTPRMTTMVMGNHGVLVIGQTVAEAFNRLYYLRARRRDLCPRLANRPAAAGAAGCVAEKTALGMGGLSGLRG
jgi:hypothetical protein